MRRRSPRLLLLLGWTLPLAAAVLLLAGLVALGVWALSTFSIPGRDDPTSEAEDTPEAIIEDAAVEEVEAVADEEASPQAEATVAEAPVEETAQPITQSATLQIRAFPWCEVWIDTRPYGRTPIDAELPPGTYRVQANNPELGWIHDQTVTVRAGQTQPLRFSPTAPGP